MAAVIVDCGLYRDRQRQDLSADLTGIDRAAREVGPGASHGGSAAAGAAQVGGQAYCWIIVDDPDEREMAHVAEAFELHPLAVRVALRTRQRPRIQAYGDLAVIAVRTLAIQPRDDLLAIGEIVHLVGSSFLISVRHGAATRLTGAALAAERAEVERQAYEVADSPGALLYAQCDRLVDGYVDVVDALDDELDKLEQVVLTDDRAFDNQALFRTQRRVARVRRALGSLDLPTARLQIRRASGIDQTTEPFLHEVVDRVRRLSEQVEALEELASSVHDAHLTNVSVRQNDDMRRISAWAAILAVPTLVAGIYGMNFHDMPELSWSFGYPVALVVMAAICVWLYRVFKRSGWL